MAIERLADAGFRLRKHHGALRFDGVHGVLSFVVQDLDYDKVLKLVYSTDGWATSQEIPMGAAGAKHPVWKTDIDQDFERW